MDVGTLLVGRRVLAVDGSEGIGSLLLELLEALMSRRGYRRRGRVRPSPLSALSIC